MNEKMWVFDIDGVLTNPETKRIEHTEILKIISEQLIAGNIIAFNSGRSAEWVQSIIINPLKEAIVSRVKNLSPLANLLTICEMGNVSVGYDENGEPVKKLLENNTIPKNLQQTIRDLVSNVYHEVMFVDESKEVILTVEMRENSSIKEFQKKQEEFATEIGIIIKNYHPFLHVRPSSTTIAIDIKPIKSGKDLGAEKILEWYQQKVGVEKSINFICFGDSLSDFEMSDYFHQKNQKTEFVYVGTHNEKIAKNYPVHTTSEKYAEGTLEFLKKLDL